MQKLGTALSVSLCGNGHVAKIWDVNKEHLKDLAEKRENTKYLPGIKLPDGIHIAYEIEDALRDADIVYFRRQLNISEVHWTARFHF